ncbi:MAG: hypothetical protein ACE5J2_02960 [Nitrososphaerales archaeon]
MRWAKVVAVLSGVMLLLSATTMNTFAARQPVSLTLEIEGCKNDMSCGADFFVGNIVTFNGSLTTEDGSGIGGAEIKIIKMIPKPELIVVASGVTGLDGSYSIEWTAEFTETEKTFQDVTKKMLSETVSIYAEFEGDDNYSQTRSAKFTVTIKANQLLTSINAERKLYAEGESALIFIAFIDSNDQFVDPDLVRVVYDDQEMEVDKKKTGSYTLITPELSIDHHQVIVLPKKEGYNPETGYLTVQVQGVEDIGRSIVKRPR